MTVNRHESHRHRHRRRIAIALRRGSAFNCRITISPSIKSVDFHPPSPSVRRLRSRRRRGYSGSEAIYASRPRIYIAKDVYDRDYLCRLYVQPQWTRLFRLRGYLDRRRGYLMRDKIEKWPAGRATHRGIGSSHRLFVRLRSERALSCSDFPSSDAERKGE